MTRAEQARRTYDGGAGGGAILSLREPREFPPAFVLKDPAAATSLRARLEHRMLLGRRKEDKFSKA